MPEKDAAMRRQGVFRGSLIEIGDGASPESIVTALKDDGWLVMGDIREPRLRIDLNKGYTPSGFAQRVFHLHIVRADDNDEVLFRDWLRGHPKDCKHYAELKQRLAAEYRNDRDGYTKAKSAFIAGIEAKAKTAQ